MDAWSVVDQLQTVKISGTTVRSYGYNSFGSATSVTSSAGTTTLAYDDDERATSLSGGGLSSQTSVYHGEGTRVSTTVGTATSNFLRDGTGVTAPVLEDGAASYTPGLSERRGSTTTFEAPGLKSVAAQTNGSAAISATRQYDAFGNVLSSTGTFKGPFGYGGAFGYQEDASGLKLLGHRYYDSGAGRFLSRDPARDGRNWYAYCENDPVGSADPLGYNAHTVGVAIGVVATVLVLATLPVSTPVIAVVFIGSVFGAAAVSAGGAVGNYIDGASPQKMADDGRSDAISGAVTGGAYPVGFATPMLQIAWAIETDGNFEDQLPSRGSGGGGAGRPSGGYDIFGRLKATSISFRE